MSCSVEGCSHPSFARGWCSMHYSRWQRYKTLDDPRSALPEERFWRFVDRTSSEAGCWLWTGGAGRYGVFWVGGKSVSAHTFSYALHYGGAIPEGLYVCHHCDVGVCVHPTHLFLGTAKENTADKFRKGRDNIPYGERCHSAKLTVEGVEEVRRLKQDGWSAPEIARCFNVSRQSVNDILWGRTWRSVPLANT